MPKRVRIEPPKAAPKKSAKTPKRKLARTPEGNIIPPAAGIGRKPGVPNKFNRVMKENIFQAAFELGDISPNGKKIKGDGKGGAVGYIKHCMRQSPQLGFAFLSKLVRTQKPSNDVEDDPSTPTIIQLNDIKVLAQFTVGQLREMEEHASGKATVEVNSRSGGTSRYERLLIEGEKV